MPALTRRPVKDSHQQGWHVYYFDVLAGWIGERAGVPHDGDHWGWHCGFHPGSHPGECTRGAAATFDDARAGFMRDWQVFLSKRSPADFEEWRYQRAHNAWKQAIWDAGHKLPTQAVAGMSKCFCGAIINVKTSGDHVRARHMEKAAN